MEAADQRDRLARDQGGCRTNHPTLHRVERTVPMGEGI